MICYNSIKTNYVGCEECCGKFPSGLEWSDEEEKRGYSLQE